MIGQLQEMSPELLEQPVRMGLECLVEGVAIRLVASLNGEVVLTTTVEDATGYAPFNAAGVRLEKEPGPMLTFVLDDLKVTS